VLRFSTVRPVRMLISANAVSGEWRAAALPPVGDDSAQPSAVARAFPVPNRRNGQMNGAGIGKSCPSLVQALSVVGCLF